jgi:predicted ATPase
MDFKLIAVTPLLKCYKIFRRVLTNGETYYLHNEYTISETCIRQKEVSVPSQLYCLPNGLQVHLAAIVGKNGSGKSTVMELVYALMFNVAWHGRILPEKDDDGEPIHPEQRLRVRICYQVDHKFYELWYDGNRAYYRVQSKADNAFGDKVVIDEENVYQLDHLFYSIVINYSHYALNAKYHRWLRYVFHKNDGYQTPIVINPFRKNGSVDMDREQELTTSRIVAGLLTLRENGQQAFTELAPDKHATHLKFTLNKDKVKFDEKEKDVEELLLENQQTVLDKTFLAFGIQKRPKTYKTSDEVLETTYLYIIKKLFTITRRYRPYRGRSYQFVRPVTEKEQFEALFGKIPKKITKVFVAKRLDALLKKMVDNPSHITFKLRQAINYVNNHSFYKTRLGKYVPITSFSDKVDQMRTDTTTSKQELMAVIPPSFFSVDIQFSEKGSLQELSSGEKQTIFAKASWMYHIINLASVREEREARYRKFSCVNLVFDEIELYFHPEMQQNFISDFFGALKRLNLGHDWGLNCIFITHSPFILSDIPHQNILFLDEKGKTYTDPKNKLTFGGNIHELLKHHFFLKEGTIGAFAKETIDSLITFLTPKDEKLDQKNLAKLPVRVIEWNAVSAKQLIELIAEPLIRDGLRSLYFKKFRGSTDIREEIARLNIELTKIEKNDRN